MDARSEALSAAFARIGEVYHDPAERLAAIARRRAAVHRRYF